MYFGESAELEYLSETKALEDYLHSEFLDNVDLKKFNQEDTQRIIGKLKKEHDTKKIVYLAKRSINYIIGIVGAEVGATLIAGPVGAAIAIVGLAIALISLILDIKDSKDIADTDFGNIANRVDKKIEELENNGGDKKLIAKLKELYNKLGELDNQEKIHKVNVHVNNYNSGYRW